MYRIEYGGVMQRGEEIEGMVSVGRFRWVWLGGQPSENEGPKGSKAGGQPN